MQSCKAEYSTLDLQWNGFLLFDTLINPFNPDVRMRTSHRQPREFFCKKKKNGVVSNGESMSLDLEKEWLCMLQVALVW